MVTYDENCPISIFHAFGPNREPCECGATHPAPRETQSTIEAWRLATFGVVSPQLIAARMNVEVAELLLELARPNPSVARVENECADVLIVLYGIAEACGFDLHEAVSVKMRINRQRTWDVRDGVGQHVAGKETP